jgi:hypothetical protein
VYAVALIGATRDDLAQENHLALLLRHGQVKITDPRQEARQLHQLVIMRGEERFGPQPGMVVDILETALSLFITIVFPKRLSPEPATSSKCHNYSSFCLLIILLIHISHEKIIVIAISD